MVVTLLVVEYNTKSSSAALKGQLLDIRRQAHCPAPRPALPSCLTCPICILYCYCMILTTVQCCYLDGPGCYWLHKLAQEITACYWL